MNPSFPARLRASHLTGTFPIPPLAEQGNLSPGSRRPTIIRTVAPDLTFTSGGVLAAIVTIRSFLSFSLEMETAGRWPWLEPDRRESSGGE